MFHLDELLKYQFLLETILIPGLRIVVQVVEQSVDLELVTKMLLHVVYLVQLQGDYVLKS